MSITFGSIKVGSEMIVVLAIVTSKIMLMRWDGCVCAALIYVN